MFKSAVGSLVVRASDSRPEGLGSMPDATKHPPSTHGVRARLNQWVRSLVGLITSAGTGEYFPPLQSRCRNCGGGDRGRVAIYRPFGELRRAKIVLSPVWCSRPTTGVPLAHATMNFVGLDLTASDRCKDYLCVVEDIVLDGIKQLLCGSDIARCRRDRRSRSRQPHCTTAQDDRWMVHIAVINRATTSRTISKQIQSVTYRSVSARTIRHCLQQSGMSARRPLLLLHLTGNHRHRQWCDERRPWTTEWNDIVFTDKSCFCLQHHDGRIRVCGHRD
ncbi:transposable element Tcb1 transposase [Trichonephila clavipes]|uniref:Transposable element Tcb1 transposase n=1 Tax=Trichonephila clavipes TaxID=2585209 RepID=A0A8X6R1U5_TRICX|nr:transposable element Tcb1 transposase [Trichonephila clavipes]